MKRFSFSRQALPWIAVAAIIVSAVLIWRTQPDTQLVEPEQTPLAASRTGTPQIAGSGVVEPSSELIEIGAHIPGVVDRVYVEPGQQVGPGAPLFSVDSRDARAAVAQAEADVASFRAQLAQAEANLATAEAQAGLYADVSDPRAVSEREVIERRGAAQQARAAVSVARAGIVRSQAALQAARVRLDRHTVRAPRAATVLQVETRAGEYATAGPAPGGNGRPLMTLGETRPLHVRIDIDENEIERVALGGDAVVSPRGSGNMRATAAFVRAEPLVVPKRSLTNSSQERVDVRVLQLIYALPPGTSGYFVGQQVDAFVPARPAERQPSRPSDTAAAR